MRFERPPTAVPKLAHQAFLYDGPEQFATTMAPLVLTRAERGERVLVVAKQATVDALRAELDDASAGVELHDTREWHPRPAQRLMAVQRAVADLPPGTGLLALGEPVWSGSEATRREWARYESMVNVALADAPLRSICLYDRSELTQGVLERGMAAHPQVLDGADICPCASFAPPERLIRELDAGGATEPAGDQRDIPFRGDHHAFRELLACLARERGMRADRAAELVLAANEILGNAVVHGAPPIAARCWVADGDFVCEISDGGPGVVDPFAGWALPPAGAEGGWGLALARRICDALELTGGDTDGARVRLYVALDSGPALA